MTLSSLATILFPRSQHKDDMMYSIMLLKLHKIIRIYINVMWDWQYYVKYSSHSTWTWEVFCIIMLVSHNTIMILKKCCVVGKPKDTSIVYRVTSQNLRRHEHVLLIFFWTHLLIPSPASNFDLAHILHLLKHRQIVGPGTK